MNEIYDPKAWAREAGKHAKRALWRHEDGVWWIGDFHVMTGGPLASGHKEYALRLKEHGIVATYTAAPGEDQDYQARQHFVRALTKIRKAIGEALK